MRNSVTIPFPCGPSAETLQNPSRSIKGLGPSGELLICFDPERQCGAVFHMSLNLWAISCPMSPGLFVYVLPDGADLQAWLDAIAGPGANATIN